MSRLLTRRRQVAVILETTPGDFMTQLDTTDSGTPANGANGYADFALDDPNITLTPYRAERNVRTASLSRPADCFISGSLATVTFTTELAGHNDNTPVTADFVEPPVGRLLSCCGLDGRLVNRLPISAWTTSGGILEHGETITDSQTPTAGEGTVFGTTIEDGSSFLYFEQPPTQAFGTSETITGGTSGDILTTTSAALWTEGRWGLKLQSGEPVGSASAGWHTCSILYIQDGLGYKLRGCAGNAVINWTTFERPTVAFTFTGIVESVDATGLMTGTVSPIVNQQKPSVVYNVASTWTDGPGGTSYNTLWNSMSLDLGNTVIYPARRNFQPGVATGIGSYDYCLITDRAPTVTYDLDGDTAFDVRSDFEAGTQWYLTEQLSPASAGNEWLITMTGATITEQPGEQDSEGLTKLPVTFACRTRADTAGFGDDDELFLVNL